MMRTQRQKQREMKHFILHRSALATEKSVATPVFAPVLGCPQQTLLRFRAVSQNITKTSYHARKHSNPTQHPR
jgi:hypothetical protein